VPQPNQALELTAPNTGFVVLRGVVAWGPQLTASVDMTSDVKGWEQLFYVFILIFPFCLSEEAEPVRHDG
jgi:hypothetical protein